MDKKAADSMPWIAAPAEHFTGPVWFGDMSSTDDEEDMNVLGVQFAPGSRTDWHSHPGGQVLHVVAGRGTVMNKGGERVEMSAGDTVTTPANEMHWHGAASDSPLFHLSITHKGSTVWSTEKVSDEQYHEGS